MGRGAVGDSGRFVRGVMTMGNITVVNITVGDVIILFHSISHSSPTPDSPNRHVSASCR